MIAFVVRSLERGCRRIRKRLVWRELLDRPWGVVHVPPRHAMSQTAARGLEHAFAGIDRSTMPAELWRAQSTPITVESIREGMRRAFEHRPPRPIDLTPWITRSQAERLQRDGVKIPSWLRILG